MTITLEPGQTGEIPLDLGGRTHNLTAHLTPGRHAARDEAAPSGYVGRHRVADGQLSTAELIALAAQQRADAGLALVTAVNA